MHDHHEEWNEADDLEYGADRVRCTDLLEEAYETVEVLEQLPGDAPAGEPDLDAYARVEDELGDLLFTLVNVARWCDIQPEEGLAGTNQRFLDRFSRVEAALGGDLQDRSIKELETVWQQAKLAIRAEQASNPTHPNTNKIHHKVL